MSKDLCAGGVDLPPSGPCPECGATDDDACGKVAGITYAPKDVGDSNTAELSSLREQVAKLEQEFADYRERSRQVVASTYAILGVSMAAGKSLPKAAECLSEQVKGLKEIAAMPCASPSEPAVMEQRMDERGVGHTTYGIKVCGNCASCIAREALSKYGDGNA